MPMDPEDRRFFVLEIELNMAIKKLIVGGLYTKLNHGLSGAQIAGYLNNVSLEGFSPDNFPPETQAKTTMINLSKDEGQDELDYALNDQDNRLITDQYAFKGLLRQATGMGHKALSKHLTLMGYVQYPGQCYWIKEKGLEGITHQEIQQIYKLVKEG